MPSGIDPNMQTLNEGRIITKAFCVFIRLLSNKTLALTSFDHDLEIDSILYEARSGTNATPLREKVGPSVDNMQFMGRVLSERINDADIERGVYTGAYVEMFEVDFLNPTAGKERLKNGTIGRITYDDAEYTFEVRSLSARYGFKVGRIISPACDCKKLGDQRCRPNDPTWVNQFRYPLTVVDVESRTVFWISAETGYADHEESWFIEGTVTWTSGDNLGWPGWVKDSQKTTVGGNPAWRIEFQDPIPYDIAIGDLVTAEAGCTRDPKQCKSKFSNLLNCRVFKFIPGTNELMARTRKF